jgi:hypothetical protein
MTPRRAAAELLRRHDAQRSLIAFTEYTFPRYRAARHHRLIAAQLERLLTGGVDRLMLLVPPRHGTSIGLCSSCRRAMANLNWHHGASQPSTWATTPTVISCQSPPRLTLLLILVVTFAT